MNKKVLAIALPIILGLAGCNSPAVESTAPVTAKISVAPVVVADMETPISAADSVGDPTETLDYNYDVDGDGVFETQGSENYPATLYHTFKETGLQKVSVKVSDSTGKTSIATQEFTVYPADYLNVDKKSELNSTVNVIGQKLIIATPTAVENTLSLRLYLNGKDAISAGQKDVKELASWTIKPDVVDQHQIDIKSLASGEYKGTIVSSLGPEKHITFVVP